MDVARGVMRMVEQTSVSECRKELSIDDRLILIQTLNALPSTQFDELIFALHPPSGNLPDKSAPQGSRTMALLEWVESPVGLGLAALEEVLGKIIAAHSKTSEQFVAFAISGKISSSTTAEIQAIVQLLRQKTGDDSIDVAFFRDGSIKLILSGSLEGLERLQALFESGELGDLAIPPIEDVHPVVNDSPDARKARLVQALSFRKQLLTKIVNRARALALDFDLALVRNIDIAHDIARARARALDIDRDHALAHDLARNIDIVRNIDIDIDIDRNLNLALDIARARALNLARDIALAHDIDIDIDRDLALARNLARNLDIDLALNLALNHNLALNLAHTLAHARNLALALARNLALVLARNLNRTDFDRAIEVDFRGINLKGANLEYLSFRGADLSGADLAHTNLAGADLTDANLANANLTDAEVTNAIFGNNLGLTAANKDDLRRRGAIFQEPPSSDVPSLVRR